MTLSKASVERYATLIAEIRATHSSLGYSDLIALLRTRHGLGKSMAEQSMKLFYSRITKTTEELREHGVALLLADYRAYAEAAHRAGKHRDAARILDSVRQMLGLGAGERLEITKTDNTARIAELTFEERAILAKLDLEPDAATESATDTEH
jgi:hypothetical protein